jgi:predicted RNA methylase
MQTSDETTEEFRIALICAGKLPDLLAIARGLLPPRARLSAHEFALVNTLPPADSARIAFVRGLIREGRDPLGDWLCALRTPEEKRTTGAIYTPAKIVESMVAWAAAQATPARVIDPGAGSGRFILAAGTIFPEAQLVAIDNDPAALLVLRANANVLGMSDRLWVHCTDYCKVRVGRIKDLTLYVGNPPYVRHHEIVQADKEWLANAALKFGLRASKLAGLHVYFFLRTRQIAQSGDYGAFVTSAEWLDVKYGSLLRSMLADGLGGTAVHVIAANSMPFDAITTGAITTFHIGRATVGLRMRTVSSIADLGDLSVGQIVPWTTARATPRWSILAHGGIPSAVVAGHIELGELFDVHRGQVTGANSIWIAGKFNGPLPQSVQFRCVTKAREIIEAGEILNDSARLRRVIDLPIDLQVLDPDDLEMVRAFIRWAKRHGADQPYVARHRRAWWSVGLKSAAPILCTYMARRPPTFAYNPHCVRHINIAHGLYPRQLLDGHTLANLARFLNSSVRASDGRTYAGGLIKFEPSEIQRLYIPNLATLNGTP